MEYDEEKVDEMVLALLYLGTFRDGPVVRAWKGFDWGTMDRYIAQALSGPGPSR